MVCPPVRGENSRALESGLSPGQTDKQWYNCIPFSTTYTLLSIEHFVPKFAILGKGGITDNVLD